MRKILMVSAAALAVALAMISDQASAKTELKVQYVQWMDGIFNKLQEAFEAAHPEYSLTFLNPYKGYDDGVQQVLRQSIAGQLPDITNQGLNRQRALVDRGLPVSLDAFIAKDPNWEADGLDGPPSKVGTYGGSVYGLAVGFAAPIAYYNMDLVRKAGWDTSKMPTDWNEMLELGRKISALGDDIGGLFVSAEEDWTFQSIVGGLGGRMMSEDEKSVAFDQPPAKEAFNIIHRMVSEAEMPATTFEGGMQSFYAGKLGVFMQSNSRLPGHVKNVGDRFELATGVFPRNDPNGLLAAGGNVTMMLTKDPEKQKAAWAFMRFVSSPQGATLVVRNSGYFPPNSKAVEDPDLLGKFYDENPLQKSIAGQIPYIGPWYAFPGENTLRISKAITDNLEALISQNVTPEQAMTTLAKDVEALIPK